MVWSGMRTCVFYEWGIYRDLQAMGSGAWHRRGKSEMRGQLSSLRCVIAAHPVSTVQCVQREPYRRGSPCMRSLSAGLTAPPYGNGTVIDHSTCNWQPRRLGPSANCLPYSATVPVNVTCSVTLSVGIVLRTWLSTCHPHTRYSSTVREFTLSVRASSPLAASHCPRARLPPWIHQVWVRFPSSFLARAVTGPSSVKASPRWESQSRS